MKARFASSLLVLGVIAVACGSCGGGGGGPAGPGNGGGGSGSSSFTATIDGEAFKADASAIVVLDGGGPRQGLLLLSGGNSQQGVSMALSFFTGPATQPLGVDPVTTPGGTAWVTTGSSSNPEFWMTPLSGDAGSVTITVRTDNRIAGAFSFVGEPTISPGPSTKTVTNGMFDIIVDAGLPPLPTGFGSTTSATIDGAAWNAAGTTVLTLPPSGLWPAGEFSLSATNTKYTIGLGIPGNAAVGTYSVPSQVTVLVLTPDGTEQWGAVSGSVTITTLNAERIAATFNATLPSVIATSTLTITNGVIDSYIGQ